MMLLFQWNALKVGDHVIMHDDADPGLVLREGVVAIVDSVEARANDIGIRLSGIQAMRRPRRFAVHMAPLDRRTTCWRCDEIASRAKSVEHNVVAA